MLVKHKLKLENIEVMNVENIKHTKVETNHVNVVRIEKVEIQLDQSKRVIHKIQLVQNQLGQIVTNQNDAVDYILNEKV